MASHLPHSSIHSIMFITKNKQSNCYIGSFSNSFRRSVVFIRELIRTTGRKFVTLMIVILISNTLMIITLRRVNLKRAGSVILNVFFVFHKLFCVWGIYKYFIFLNKKEIIKWFIHYKRDLSMKEFQIYLFYMKWTVEKWFKKSKHFHSTNWRNFKYISFLWNEL